MTMLAFEVRGLPKPQGSKRAVPIYAGKGEAKRIVRANVVDANPQALLPWREAVKQAAVTAMGSPVQRAHFGHPIEGPVGLYLVLVQPRPAGHFLKDGSLSAAGRAMPYPIGRDPGDVDKLLRAVMDALADAGVYQNDKQVAHIDGLDKVYVGHPGAPRFPGAQIIVRSLLHEGRKPVHPPIPPYTPEELQHE